MADGVVRGLGQPIHWISTAFTSTPYGTQERKQDKRENIIIRNIDVAARTYDRNTNASSHKC